ncbi:ATP-dependent DNA ligase [Nocardioides sp. Root1257]|uniref:ATP-dependent DNA ligase n=1 Tax=unclassified Nocardioides TaxID=2615069 RepID=UPI0006F5584A|nr:MULTISPECIES: ATP-dependent DNA ligase [unclassified Nocardioides]KQW53133.1 ATP-dependent DNA ligase [Nocardioides sp. Root1257]KRC55821.1 ATP-dependent DNA ligase [Nocardioides sp. Root224]
MLLADVVATSATVAATRSRKAKVEAIAALLRVASADEVETVTAYVGGSLRQRRTGLGWRGLSSLPAPAPTPSLTVAEVHEAFETIAALSGSGSQAARSSAVDELFGRATAEEQTWLRGVVTGAVRQGALDSLVQEALAVAAEVPLPAVRRAAMLGGSTVAVAAAAFSGVEALAAVGLEVGRPVVPMLASSAPSVGEALAKAGSGAEVAVDVKLDGIRIQVHRSGDEVLVATRSLEDITARLPEVVEVARSLPATSFVLDGEALALADDGRPRPFQETASRTAMADGVVVTPYFFDVLHLDGVDLLDAPAAERAEALERLVPAEHRVPRLVTASVPDADAFLADTLGSGHEGVVVKSLTAPYDAGRRGAAWVKVKPVHTLDLVVLGVEWGSGRREGWLSNIHLGARDASGDGFVMLGKTFKGMTDEMLAWQTVRFTELAVTPSEIRAHYAVEVRPEQVVEIAFDGVQRSTRYPGGVALRFARVVRYRDDKPVSEIDTIETVRGYLS